VLLRYRVKIIPIPFQLGDIILKSNLTNGRFNRSYSITKNCFPTKLLSLA